MDGAIINISIWQSPDIKLPARFSFPDETGQFGLAYIHSDNPLSGEVSFLSVDEAGPVEGEFNLKDESGRQFNGRFKAEWGNEVIYCG